MAWDDRPYAGRDWVPLSQARLSRPERVTLRDGAFALSYHTSWGVEEFVTVFRFTKDDLDQELERLTSSRE